MPAFQGRETRQEVWRLSNDYAASAAAGTKVFSTVTRTPGGVSVDTSSVQLSLPIVESAVFVDWYVASTTDNTASILYDMEINGIAQRVGLLSDAILVTNLTRPRMRPLSANPGSSIAPFTINPAAIGTTNPAATISYLVAQVVPRGA